MPKVVVYANDQIKRRYRRKKSMDNNDQREASIDLARALQNQGIEVGDKMTTMIVQDDLIRGDD